LLNQIQKANYVINGSHYMKINHLLPGEVLVSKYSQDFIEQYQIDEKTDWLAQIIKELEEENDDEIEREPAHLEIDANITRKTDKFLGEHLILKSNLKGFYHLPCGRCLTPIKQEIEMAINAAFLHDSQEKMPEYMEVTTVFAAGQEMELYFFHKGMADIKEVFHEQLFTEIAPFPRCDGECKGPIYF
jgi:uncharacterized metal-binding protein YceD (DUF177 family)